MTIKQKLIDYLAGRDSASYLELMEYVSSTAGLSRTVQRMLDLGELVEVEKDDIVHVRLNAKTG